MTTNSETTVRSIYEVHPDPTDAVAGTALVTYIVAVAARRDRLRTSIISTQFHQKRGIGILVKDAGQREHLANALGFERASWNRVEFKTPEGTGHARVGTIEGVEVHIWNLEP
jgi:hypothetical protein